MIKHKNTNKIVAGFFVFLLTFVFSFGNGNIVARAASGSVYTCSIVPSYSNPVTGEIEDAGGEGAYATGQGMVESALYTTGILEVADNGSYYLTVRFSLGDFTSGHSFLVQNVGESQWYEPSVSTTGQGSDSNGSTFDACIQVPSENCLVRGSMYVEPMGRNVVFYLYPTDYTEGNSTDMNATIVTEQSGSKVQESAPQAPSGNASLSSGSTGSIPEQKKESSNTSKEGKNDNAKLKSSLSKQDGENNMPKTDGALSESQGLSLSTKETSDGKTETASHSSVQMVVIITISIVTGGLILIGVAAAIVYYFHRNWKRWGGGEDDDE